MIALVTALKEKERKKLCIRPGPQKVVFAFLFCFTIIPRGYLPTGTVFLFGGFVMIDVLYLHS